MAQSRRSFLKSLGAAFCGAVLVTLPDFAPRPPRIPSRFGVRGGNLISMGVKQDFHDAYKKQWDQMLAAFEKMTDGPPTP